MFITKLLITPIYKRMVLAKFRAKSLPHIDIYKLAGQFGIGAIVMLNIALVSIGQPTATLAALTPTEPTGHYVNTTGYMDNRDLDLELQQAKTTSWVTTTRRLSRGFSSGHHALDVDGEFGDPIYAYKAGEITLVSSTGPLGNHIVIQHNNGLQTVYAHLQTLVVQTGQFVHAGQTIGTMGSTGRSTGSHLHFEAYDNGVIFDPATLF